MKVASDQMHFYAELLFRWQLLVFSTTIRVPIWGVNLLYEPKIVPRLPPG